MAERNSLSEICCLLGVALVFALSTTVAKELDSFPVVDAIMLVSTIIVGFLLTLRAAEACRPLQSGVLSEQRRRND